MPEQTEVLSKKVEEVEDKNESGTDSDSEDDSIPELEDTAGQTQGANPLAAAAGLNEDLVSKAKQSRGEKKARKIMSKLGLKQVHLEMIKAYFCLTWVESLISSD
jgi:nascent polypeptide-associated complex subunit alpha